MKLNEYQVLAHKTANTNLTRNEQLLVAALGLVDEAVEVLELYNKALVDLHALRKELGDVYWYDGELCTLLGLPLTDTERTLYAYWGSGESLAKKLVTSAKDVGELIKKHAGHGHVLDMDLFVSRLSEVTQYLNVFAANYIDGGREAVLQANIDKLRARYGEKFSTAASVNRVDTVDAVAAAWTQSIDYAKGEGRNV